MGTSFVQPKRRHPLTYMEVLLDVENFLGAVTAEEGADASQLSAEPCCGVCCCLEATGLQDFGCLWGFILSLASPGGNGAPRGRADTQVLAPSRDTAGMV